MPSLRSSRFRYRFTFFQWQFLSHLVISLLIVLLLSISLFYYMKQHIYDDKTNDLSDIAHAIGKLLSGVNEEDKHDELQAYRNLLSESRIYFTLLNQEGELIYNGSHPRSRVYLDNLRKRIAEDSLPRNFTLKRHTDEPLVVVSSIIAADHAPDKPLYLFVASPLQGIQQTAQTFYRAMLYMILLVCVLAVVVSWMLSRSMSRSIRSLQRATRQISAGNYAARAEVTRSDELGDLTDDFNSMAERLEAASRELERLEQRRRHFIMDVTHELRTPLTSIRGIIEGLRNNLVERPEDRNKYYLIIEKETFRLIRLINELLDMERIESGMISLYKRHIALSELFALITESLEVLLKEKRISIVIECPDELYVYGDYDRIMQILINLVKNSIQFTDSGTIRLEGTETGQHTTIRIADTGRGMTEEELSLMWERFYKADLSRSKNNSETGLGLSIVKQLVEAHGGNIQAKSAPGQGTVFTIRLPKQRLDEMGQPL